MDRKRRKMLEIIFKAREEKLATLTSEDKIFFKEHNIDRGARRDSLEAELEKMPKDFRQLKETIETKLEDYIETVNRENWYLCKKYYLAGQITTYTLITTRLFLFVDLEKKALTSGKK